MPLEPVPCTRILALNEEAVRTDGGFVLYWMVAFRRTRYNFALQRAACLAEELGKPLLVLEALRCGYRWASVRLHRFVLEGMRDNRARLADGPAFYHPYVEPAEGDGKGLLEALARKACLVVSDDFPCFFLPRMQRAFAERCPVRLELVDGNGILPMRGFERAFPRAHGFRRAIHKRLPETGYILPLEEPLAGLTLPPLPRLPELDDWPAASDALLRCEGEVWDALPIDREVGPASFPGGSAAGEARLARFLAKDFASFPERNHPDDEVSSGLSPYLHFGHVSSAELFARIIAREDWELGEIDPGAVGKREGWWGMSAAAEAFLDQIITWRELGYNMCVRHPDTYDCFSSLPDWAHRTIDEHRDDPREHVYSLEELTAAATHDEVWNAAQRQLVREGRMHNYLRMLWGKNIVLWSETPERALEAMIELNNRFAVDGRNPNSYSGIFWVLGRYDRAWGPEREVTGKLRPMTSKNTKRKLRIADYLARYGE